MSRFLSTWTIRPETSIYYLFPIHYWMSSWLLQISHSALAWFPTESTLLTCVTMWPGVCDPWWATFRDMTTMEWAEWNRVAPTGLVSLEPLSLPDYNITSSTAISEQHSVKYSTHNPYIVRWLIGDTISASHLSHPGPCYNTKPRRKTKSKFWLR